MLRQSWSRSQETVEVQVRPGEPVKTRVIRHRKASWRDASAAARDCGRRLKMLATLDVTHYSWPDGKQTLSIFCHVGNEHKTCASFAEAIDFFCSVGVEQPTPSPSPTTDDYDAPPVVDIVLGPDADLGEAIKRKIGAKVTTKGCTSKAGDGEVTERWANVELSRDELIVDVTLQPDRAVDFAWDGTDDTGQHRIHFTARESGAEFEPDRTLATYRIDAEVLPS